MVLKHHPLLPQRPQQNGINSTNSNMMAPMWPDLQRVLEQVAGPCAVCDDLQVQVSPPEEEKHRMVRAGVAISMTRAVVPEVGVGGGGEGERGPS